MTRTAVARHKLILLATGGTGGHVFPAKALAEELWCRGYTIVLVTDQRGIAWHSTLEGLTVHAISAGGLVGCSLSGVLRGTVRLTWGMGEALFLLRRFNPAVVVGFGGYASVPAIAAAVLAGYPTVVHEQNAVLGRANRLLAPWVSRVAVSFATVGHARTDRIHTGMPVRLTVQSVREVPYLPPSGKDLIDVLVIGGSQGAHIFSEVIPTALNRLPATLRTSLRVSQQVRAEDHKAVAAAYNNSGIAVELAPFFNDVPTRLAKAHLIIARAGASTVAELTVAGRPAILVPYPHAANNHQTANARAVAETGGAWLMPQGAFTPATLATRLQALFTLPAIMLAKAAMCARAIALPDATRRLADMVESLALHRDSSIAPRMSNSGWTGIDGSKKEGIL